MEKISRNPRVKGGNGVFLNDFWAGESVCILVLMVITQIYRCVKMHRTADQNINLKTNLKMT